MTIVASGNVISMGGNVQLSGFNESIEYELKASYGNTTTGTSQISMNDSAVRGLANIATGAISLANLYGKSSILPKHVAIITAGTAVTLPSNWNTANCSIEVIGGGQGGGYYDSTGTGRSGTGGIGGSYAKIVNFGAASTSYTISIGSGTTGGSTTPPPGGNTWLSSTGSAPTSTSQGVLAGGGNYGAVSIGSTTYIGGGGGAKNSLSGGGGGGAAGPNGAGINGSAAVSSVTGGTGGNGDNGSGGAGGVGSTGSADPGPGAAGTEWTVTTNTISGTGLTLLSPSSTAGSGGGGGGGASNWETFGGDGGLYGGGGGGGSYNSAYASSSNGGTGQNGIIVLTWYA